MATKQLWHNSKMTPFEVILQFSSKVWRLQATTTNNKIQFQNIKRRIVVIISSFARFSNTLFLLMPLLHLVSGMTHENVQIDVALLNRRFCLLQLL
jgi:hypothetical protein